MIKNYIIVAHKDEYQLLRLIKKLDDHESSFYIHIDAKSDLSKFTNIIKGKHIHFLSKRVDCIWGDFSKITATIYLIESVLEAKNKGITITLSGQDYPIKSNEKINSFLCQNNQYDFIDFDMDPIPENSDFYSERILKFKINYSSERGDYGVFRPIFKMNPSEIKDLCKIMLHAKNPTRKKLLLLFAPKRHTPFQFHYQGEAWWAFQFETLNKIYNYVQQHRKILFNYYKYTLCPDEQFFHTILKEIMKTDQNIHIKNSLHFIDWSIKDSPSPLTLRESDLNIILSQPENKLFARKFDTTYDEKILDLIDTNS